MIPRRLEDWIKSLGGGIFCIAIDGKQEGHVMIFIYVLIDFSEYIEYNCLAIK